MGDAGATFLQLAGALDYPLFVVTAARGEQWSEVVMLQSVRTATTPGHPIP